MANPSEDAIEMMLMAQEVVDFIDENPITGMGHDELNSSITRLEQMRSNIRRKEVKVSSAGEVIAEDVKMTVNHAIIAVKDFIKTVNDVKSKTRFRQERANQDQSSHKDRTTEFLLNCIHHTMSELQEIFKRDTSEADSINLLIWRKEEAVVNKKFEKVQEDYKECLQAQITNADNLFNIKETGEKFNYLTNLRLRYVKELAFQINERELDKHAEFTKLKLDIKIEKFSDFDASTDFYTFRSNFEKVHLSSTPKEHLPDLLRNNYLTDPARTMVSNLTSIDEVWERLREAFGDPKNDAVKKTSATKEL